MLRTHSHTAKYKGVGMCVSLSPLRIRDKDVHRMRLRRFRDDIGLDDEIVAQVDQFITHLERTGRKEGTLYNYTHMLGFLLKYLQESGRSARVEDISVEDIYYIKSTYDVAETALRLYLRALSRYVHYHTGEDIVKQADLLWNTVEHKRKFITMEDLAVLLEAADPYTKAALLMGAMMGLRRAEICEAKWSDIQGRMLKVYGKGHGKGKLAYVPIPDAVLDALDEAKAYRETHGRIAEECDNLIQCTHSTFWGPITPGGLGNKILALGRDMGVDVSTHSLRRLFATTLYNEVGADLHTVKDMMRHERVEVTINCYINPDPSKKEKARSGLVDAFSRII